MATELLLDEVTVKEFCGRRERVLTDPRVQADLKNPESPLTNAQRMHLGITSFSVTYTLKISEREGDAVINTLYAMGHRVWPSACTPERGYADNVEVSFGFTLLGRDGYDEVRGSFDTFLSEHMKEIGTVHKTYFSGPSN